MLYRLARETSPYLLQHAENPVDWYPWGEEALERAKAEDKPILLSIGSEIEQRTGTQRISHGEHRGHHPIYPGNLIADDSVGELKDVMWLPANDVYVVFNGEKELLIPIVNEVVLSVDYDKKEILIANIDGLIS